MRDDELFEQFYEDDFFEKAFSRKKEKGVKKFKKRSEHEAESKHDKEPAAKNRKKIRRLKGNFE